MNIRRYHVTPALPANLAPLKELAYNLYWSWDPDTVDLFRRLDLELWRACGHNPARFLSTISQERLDAASEDDSFLAFQKRVVERFQAYINSQSWFQRTYPELADTRIAYFCAEFGVAESLTIYSGGLGMLAGDHLKSASDLGLPLVGIGLLYQMGYFRQRLDADGRQEEQTQHNEFLNMPIQMARGEDGAPLMVEVTLLGQPVRALLWRANVGRVPLFLLDTDVEENRQEDRLITDQLYGGDSEKRIRQEILLGIGGIRALDALGIEAEVFHMNEGHSAFLGLERIRKEMANQGVSFQEALEATRPADIFTTHTPVPAGFDLFSPDLVEKYFQEYREGLGLSKDQFLGLGRENPTELNEWFNMAVLALRLAGGANAVSQLHGQVSRRILGNVWPSVPKDEVPITHVTNGVHFKTWISRDLSELLVRYIGAHWHEGLEGPENWDRIQSIPDEEFWHTHERRRERLVALVRSRLIRQISGRNASRAEFQIAEESLRPEALTIGFARRFATYKRAGLILSDPPRLKKILASADRPVQIIFAGKAHPQDEEGKELIRQIVHFARDPEICRSVVFLEDYDMDLARGMVQGVDVWLNNPRRFMEASGTSGMKAAINGVLNLSILDGWWYEGYSPEVGWAIGGEELYEDRAFQDAVESRALYDLLEEEVVPLFYERSADDLPRRWIERMKNAMRTLGPVFNSRRMVREYSEKLYTRSARRSRVLRAEGLSKARELARWKSRITQQWPALRLLDIHAQQSDGLRVGEHLHLETTFDLGGLSPSDLSMEAFYGNLNEMATIEEGVSVRMEHSGEDEQGRHHYIGAIPCTASGRWGYAIRALPDHPDLQTPMELGLISWF